MQADVGTNTWIKAVCDDPWEQQRILISIYMVVVTNIKQGRWDLNSGFTFLPSWEHLQSKMHT